MVIFNTPYSHGVFYIIFLNGVQFVFMDIIYTYSLKSQILLTSVEAEYRHIKQ